MKVTSSFGAAHCRPRATTGTRQLRPNVTFPAMKRRIPQIPRMCFTDSTDSTYSCTPRPALPRQTRCSRFCGLSCLLRVLKRPVQALVSKTFVFAAAAGCSLKSGNRKLVDGCCCTYQTPLFEFSDSSRQNIHRLKHSRRKQYSRMPHTDRPKTAAACHAAPVGAL